MARPAWTNIVDTDIDVDSPGETDVFTALRDNAESTRITMFFTDVSEQTTTSTSYVVAASIPIYVPDVADYTGIQRLINMEIDVKVSAGTADYRLVDNATATAGTAGQSTATSYEQLRVELNINSAWKGTTRTIDIEQKINAGANTAYVRSTARVASYMEY